MTAAQKPTYRRQKNTGTVTISGVVDIFEAEALKSVSLKALEDENATSVVVNLAKLVRLDVAALQVLLALETDVAASGRTCVFRNPPAVFEQTLANLGLSARR